MQISRFMFYKLYVYFVRSWCLFIFTLFYDFSTLMRSTVTSVVEYIVNYFSCSIVQKSSKRRLHTSLDTELNWILSISNLFSSLSIL
jgi:hypothetical protein